jgi:hypothetical protein
MTEYVRWLENVFSQTADGGYFDFARCERADGTFYGWVEELPGVWSNGASLNECQQELQAVIEDWLLLGLKLGHRITPLGAIDLNEPVKAGRLHDGAA